jgi:hypothetical protein
MRSWCHRRFDAAARCGKAADEDANLRGLAVLRRAREVESRLGARGGGGGGGASRLASPCQCDTLTFWWRWRARSRSRSWQKLLLLLLLLRRALKSKIAQAKRES